MFFTENSPISRPLYMNDIKGFIDKPLVKVITGLRRSGKTETLKLIIEEIINTTDKDHIIYMNFEEMDFEDILTYKDLNAYMREKFVDGKKYYIFLDEIQRIDEWEKSVNALRLKNTDIYITGSNSKIMSDDLASLLGGRTISFRVTTLSFVEFLNFRSETGLSTSSIDSELEAYIDIGGFPMFSVLHWEEKDYRRAIKDINNTALLKDVILRHKIRMPQVLDRIVTFVYDNVGNIISITSIVKYLKSQGIGTDAETVSNYMKYLEDAFIIKSCQRYDIKGKQLLETINKYYLADHSLQYALRSKRPDKVQGILENIIFSDLSRRGYEVYVGKIEDKEIDFIATEMDGTKKVYIQVCLEFTNKDTYEREFSPLRSINNNYHKYVVTLDKNWRADENGIEGIHLKDFLLKEEL